MENFRNLTLNLQFLEWLTEYSFVSIKIKSVEILNYLGIALF